MNFPPVQSVMAAHSTYPTFLSNIKSLLDVMSPDAEFTTHSEFIIKMLEEHQLAPKMPFSKKNVFYSETQSTLPKAISECLF